MEPDDGAQFLAVLADDTRIRILRLLAEGDCDVSAVSDALEIKHYAASRHLSALKSVGLVEGRKDSRRVIYSLTDAGRSGRVDLGCCALDFAGHEAS